MHLRPMLGQTLDRRNLLIPSDDDCDVSRRSSPAAQARAPGPYADTYAVAVNLVVVESDGSRPDRPDYLRGGEQARRHRAACNRGHGLLRCCVEFEVALVPRSNQPKHYRARSRSAQISGDHRFEMTPGSGRLRTFACLNPGGNIDPVRSSHAGEANRRSPAEVVRQNNLLGVKVSELSGRPIEEPIISGLIDAPRSRDCDIQGHRGWRGWPIIAWRPLRRPAPQLQVPPVARPRESIPLSLNSNKYLRDRRIARRFTRADSRTGIVAVS